MSLRDRFHGAFVHPRRVRVLAAHAARMLPPGARVLDIGCGDGLLASRLAAIRADVEIVGADVQLREHAHIPVWPFDGTTLPFGEGSFDVAMLVDVLHHTVDPTGLLREARRVARHALLVKDHTREGVLAGSTLRLMDRVGNARFGVPLPYTYWRDDEWRAAFLRLDLRPTVWITRLGMYLWPAAWVFERSLHFIALLEPVPSAGVQ